MNISETSDPVLRELVDGLQLTKAYPHDVAGEIVVRQTHISWVFLAGDYAYKVKKPVETNFLDYSTLERRRKFCHEELRLDQRYAPELYLDVVPITCNDGQIRVAGKGDVVEYAVKMRRFPQDALLCDRLEKSKLSTSEVHQLARSIADFHQSAARVDPNLPWGSPEIVALDARDNLRHLHASAVANPWESQLAELDRWTDDFLAQHQELISQRVANGFVRECHGDLHLSNVIRWHDQLLPFDGIEFNDEFRWIDVLSDAAFLAMDFAAYDHLDLCRSFVNAYLESTGDHASLPLLRWYLVYRAMVRAKVASIRAEQLLRDEQADESAVVAEDCGRHILLAKQFTEVHQPCLWITHGLSGSGKTTGSECVVQRRGAIRLRSDIERKRHFGLPPDHRPNAGMKQKLYSESATAATYDRLRRIAQKILMAGYSVIVDATFVKQHQREMFRKLADQRGVGFAILDFHTDEQTMRQRIADRMARKDDASDADAQVLELQMKSSEPLSAAEMPYVVEIPDAMSVIHAL